MSDDEHPTALRFLRNFGLRSFRPHQAAVVARVCGGGDALAVLATGAGKSLTYMLPALMLPGPVVVFSPLVALVQEQIAVARSAGLRAARFPCDDTRADILFASPEALARAGGAAALAALRPSLVVVDEVHCILEWSDFRPAFLLIGRFINGLVPRPPVLALTATATAAERGAVTDALSMDISDGGSFVGTMDRPNIFMRGECVASADVLPVCIRVLGARDGGRAIIYFSSRRGAETGAAACRAGGVSAASYHSELSGLQKSVVRDYWDTCADACICATSAWGMGLDTGSVRLVVSADVPRSVGEMAQALGRAGRDGSGANYLVLHSGGAADPFVDAVVSGASCRRRAMLSPFDAEPCGTLGTPCCDVCDVHSPS
jgi:ATP-dependent DNA helicase RecQ